MFEHIGMVAGMKGVAVAEHGGRLKSEQENRIIANLMRRILIKGRLNDSDGLSQS
ncbi:hypothetical protein [Neisseria weixii]|uniref:hypothetical protein n=1 Tax=Neisseria weixii TaxID=1853276 RepID=UPI0018F585E1|nr:hypothetical protein [Neisseria weixii]